MDDDKDNGNGTSVITVHRNVWQRDVTVINTTETSALSCVFVTFLVSNQSMQSVDHNMGYHLHPQLHLCIAVMMGLETV